MIPWYIGTLLGSVMLAIKNSMSRTLDMTYINIMLMQIPLIAAGMFYWYGFRYAPKFIYCWFLGTAFNTIIALLLGILIFDKSITATTVFGIACVLLGTYLLKV